MKCGQWINALFFLSGHGYLNCFAVLLASQLLYRQYYVGGLRMDLVKCGQRVNTLFSLRSPLFKLLCGFAS